MKGEWSMSFRSPAITALTIFLLFFVDCYTADAAGADETPDLSDGFVSPPLQARPRAYWAWMNGYVNLPQLNRELEDAREKGMGGLDIFDVGAIDDPDGIVPAGPAFLGPESLEAIDYVVRRAGQLGLELGLITSSSWNAGGPWVKPENGQMGLFYSEAVVTGPGLFTKILPFPEVPETCVKGQDGLPVYYKDTAVLALPWDEKKLIKDVESVKVLTRRLDVKGRLLWHVPPGKWVIMRFVCVSVGQHLYLPSPNSTGLIIDHFSAEAVEMHFEYIVEKLLQQMPDLKDTALKFLYLPSYEVASYGDAGLVWTPKMVEQFEKYRTYDMTPYLPVLFGWTMQDKDITSRFKYDFNKTLSDLIIDCHYAKAREVSNKYGLALCSEAGGPGQPLHNCPFEALRALGALDVPRGEFWNQHYFRDDDGIDILWLVKEIACASHIYGKKIVDMEAFTSFRHWQDGPFELKGLADRAMCGGTNLFTFHTSPHTPPQAGKPGWAYHAGTHMGTNRVWWPMAKPFMDYLARCSYLLQQGLFVADVCYYYGDKAPNFVKPKHVDPSLGSGYDYDVTNSEVILTRMSVKDGKIVLPDGISYELLVLPDEKNMPLKVLQKLETMVQQGALIVGAKPTGVDGLADYKIRSEQVRRLADKIWGSCDGDSVTENSYGKGKIIQGRSLKQILRDKGIGPDFVFIGKDKETDLDYIHRRTDKEDIYFVTNKRMRADWADCVFRVSGKVPELWAPDTGRIRSCVVYDFVQGGTRVRLRFEPKGSVFVVFRKKADKSNITAVKTDGQSVFPIVPGTEHQGDCVKVSLTDKGAIEAVVLREGEYVFERAGGRKIVKQIGAVPLVVEIVGPWEVRFPHGWGGPQSKVFERLISWTEDSDDGVKYFSGIATYYKQFTIAESLVGDDRQLVLDLGSVRVTADVYLNGRHLGILWKQPFAVDITDAVKPGSNHLVVEVANTWSNRLAGDARNPDSTQYCRTNISKAVNDRFLPLVPWKKAELLESGLMGPVRLLSAKKIELRSGK